jgi:hypothetical protein
MSWQSFTTKGTFTVDRISWKRYLPAPDGVGLKVCYACGEEIQRYDRQQEARDQRRMCIGRIGVLLSFATLFIAVLYLYWFR